MLKMIRYLKITLLYLSAMLSQALSDIVPVTVLSTKDIHSFLLPDDEDRGGLARISAYNKKVRLSQKNVLILNAGDMASGTAVYGHKPIDPAKTYRVVTNSFVRDQWEQDHPELASVEWDDTGITLRDSVLQYMEKRPRIDKVRLVR